jgi:hypothetical protein
VGGWFVYKYEEVGVFWGNTTRMCETGAQDELL